HTLEHTIFPYTTLFRSEELDDIIDWLGELVTQVDSSLVDEWAQMADPDKPLDEQTLTEVAYGEDPDRPVTGNKRAFVRMIRNLIDRKSTRLNSSHVSIS